VYLGVRALLGPEAKDGRERPVVGRRRLFCEGAMVSALNPKTALFFLAFLPQFVDPAQGTVAFQAFVLGSCFVALATVSDSAYALLAGTAGARLREGRLLARLSGGVYLGLGAFAAFAGERPAD
jgi:threonine/homoserine/homoserine lactone efflux protein